MNGPYADRVNVHYVCRDSNPHSNLNHCFRHQGIDMDENYDGMTMDSCKDLPPDSQIGWSLVGFKLSYGEDGPSSTYYWARNRKQKEEKIEINGGAPQNIWARHFELKELDYNEQPGDKEENWMVVFMDTITYPVDLGPNRDESPKKTETRVVWAKAKASTNS